MKDHASAPNEEQQEVIDCPAPRLLCIAGPGSGKTRTLLWRIQRLVDDGAVPGRMVVITFTNAAADELSRRALSFTDGLALGYVGTLHRYMLGLLGKFGREIGLPAELTILPNPDEFLDRVIETLGYTGTKKDVEKAMEAEWPREAQSGRWSPADIVAARVYSEMVRQGTLTFDAILRFGLALLRKGNVSLRADYLFVDEYQDSSDLDAEIYELLDIPMKFLVGDPDQSIYAFRGGNVANIIRAVNKWEVKSLEINYRSAVPICAAANQLITKNYARWDKRTEPALDRPGSTFVVGCDSPENEGLGIAREIRESAGEGKIAVLFRYNRLVDQYSRLLESYSIPIVQPVNDLPHDWDRALLLVGLLVSPDNDYLAKQWLTVTLGAKRAAEEELIAAKAGKSINDKHLHLPAPPADPDYFIDAMQEAQQSPEAMDRVNQICLAMPQFTPEELIVRMHGERWNSHDEGSGVLVTTMHGAKGREFDTVFLPAFEQSIIPGKNNLEEERRLAYVAVTRAKTNLCISFCRGRPSLYGFSKVLIPSQPSQFIEEMGLSIDCQ